MFGIGETELAIILVFAFLLFGPDKLPGVGRTVGRALRQFRDAEEGFTKVVQTEVIDPMNRAAAGEDEQDDVPAPSAAGSTPAQESFAERKARMEAERAASSTAADNAAPASDAAPANDAAAAEDTTQAAEEAAQKAAEDKRRSLAALYGLSQTEEGEVSADSAAAESSKDAAAPETPEDGEEAGSSADI